MLALLAYYLLGWHAAAAELAAELAIGLLLYCGGGGKRIRKTLRAFLARPVYRGLLGGIARPPAMGQARVRRSAELSAPARNHRYA